MKKRLLGLVLALCAAAFTQTAMSQITVANPEDLYTKGSSVYHLDRQLTKAEVREMLANTEFLEMFDRGLQNNRNGNIWLVVSGGMLVGTAVYAGMATGSGYTSSGTYVVAGMTEIDKLIVSLCACATAGVATFAILKKGQGLSLVRSAVGGYAHREKKPGAELALGLTGYGVGLMLKF